MLTVSEPESGRGEGVEDVGREGGRVLARVRPSRPPHVQVEVGHHVGAQDYGQPLPAAWAGQIYHRVAKHLVD